MAEAPRVRQRAVQNRTVVTRGKITQGAIEVLARAGVPGLTHRAVAEAAGVGLAATTYHFATKGDIIDEASRTLLEGYLAAFRRMAGRIAAGEERRIASLDDLVERVVLNAVGRERTRSLAWSELILHGGRNAAGKALAQSWYEQLDVVWYEIARLVDPKATREKAAAAIDLTVGLTFVLHPLGLKRPALKNLISGKRDIGRLLQKVARPSHPLDTDPDQGRPGKRHAETRQKIVEAAIGIIIEEGVAGISNGRVAKATDMVRSGPSYYFGAVEEIVENAQMALFDRAKRRYRAGLASVNPAEIDESRLLDLTTAILYREALEFGRESIGHYSVWMRAAQEASLRPAVASSLLDQHRAWSRRITSVYGKKADEAAVAMRVQALFLGKLIRIITAAVPTAGLSSARADFAAMLRGSDRR